MANSRNPVSCEDRSWRPILIRYRQGRRAIEKIYQDMLETFEGVIQSKVFGDEITIGDLIHRSEKDDMVKCLATKPSIAFIGQVNAGKSSLANELIGGGSWLPVAPEPCTSRMVRLKYSKHPYKQKIPFHGDPVEKQPMKNRCPTVEDIRLSDEEKKDPKVFEVEVSFGVPNPYLRPDLEIIDLPGWSEKETLDRVIKEAVEKISSPLLLPIYVLNGNQLVTGADRQLIDLLTRTFRSNQLLFVCNKIDHVHESLRLSYGNGKLDVLDDGSSVYTVDDRETKLLNKGQATFESLVKFGFVPDFETENSNSSNYYAVSAKMTKARRSKDATLTHFKYYEKQYDNFTSHLNSRLEKVLVKHVLGMVRSANVVVSRFARGTLMTRAAELSSDVRMYDILQEAGAAEQQAYTNFNEFLSKETKAIEDAVEDSLSAAQPKIIKNAIKITTEDIETNQADCPLPLAFSSAIATMAGLVIHREIVSRIDTVMEKYVAGFSFFVQVVVGSCDDVLNDIFRCLFQVDRKKKPVKDETIEAGVGLFRLIPDAVFCALDEAVPEDRFTDKILFNQIARVSLKILDLDQQWKESIAREFLTMMKESGLASAILKHCRRKLDEMHTRYVQSHSQMMALRKAKSSRSQEAKQYLRTHFTPRIALLLLRLYAMQCALENGEPEQGAQIGEGRHCAVSTCPGWGGLKNPNALVLKTFVPLSHELWGELAQSFYAMRTVQGKDRHVVKLYGALIRSLDGKEEEHRLILVMERRTMTLPEALRRGLSRDERKLIALDIAEALSFFHRKFIVYENLTTDCVSLDRHNRAKLEVMKIRRREDSWLGCPAFHQAPEVHRDEKTRNVATDVYSFGILLWEIFSESLQPPACYADCTNNEDMKKKVCDEDLRPSKPDHLADEWYYIMQDCWNKKPDGRPSMENLTTRIETLVFNVSYRDEEAFSCD